MGMVRLFEFRAPEGRLGLDQPRPSSRSFCARERERQPGRSLCGAQCHLSPAHAQQQPRLWTQPRQGGNRPAQQCIAEGKYQHLAELLLPQDHVSAKKVTMLSSCP